MNSKPSPLFVWKLILVVILAAGAFLSFSDPIKVIFARRDVRLSDQLAQTHFKKDEIGIIFLGDSLLRAVLPYKDESVNTALAGRFQQGELKSRISAVKVTTGGIWNIQELSEQLIEARPSIIVIQSEMVVRRIYKNRPEQPLKERVGTWSGILGLKVFGHSQQQRSKEGKKQFFTIEKQAPKARPRTKKSDESLEVTRHLWSNQVVSTADPIFIMARRFINRASATGIRVVLVELPVSNTSAGFSSREYFTKRTAALQSLSKSGAVTFVYPRILPDEYFVDYNHANPRSRREFLNWFYPVLADELLKYERRSS